MTAGPATGSTVTTIPPPARLVLRAVETPRPQQQEPRVKWAEDVIDNEGMGKKSSKGMIVIFKDVCECKLT